MHIALVFECLMYEHKSSQVCYKHVYLLCSEKDVLLTCRSIPKFNGPVSMSVKEKGSKDEENVSSFVYSVDSIQPIKSSH